MNNFQIYSDNQENQGVQTRNGAKRVDNQAAPKRTALGQVTNLRQQPSRAAKQAPFKIYEDAENVPAQPKSQLSGEEGKRVKTTKRPPSSRNTALLSVANIASVRAEQEVNENKAAFDSPMVLDVSCMETDEVDDVVSPAHMLEVEGEDGVYCMAEYQEDIHDYLREAELRFRPKLNYMRKQADITPQMRTILVDWLVEVGEEYKLHDETLHLAVNYIDRFLSQMAVLRGKLQLVGTACMYIASKYEEIYPPDVGEFVYITDDTYTKRQLLRMEHLVIKVLGFDVAAPTANVFSDLYCRQLQASDPLRFFTQYTMELSMLDCDNYLVYRPSVIASAALFLATHIVPCSDIKISDIERVTRFTQAEVSACVERLLSTLKSAGDQPQQAVRDKYKTDSKRAVALIPIPDLC